MLNELHALQRGLTEANVDSVAKHPDVSQLLKGDVVRVRLAELGEISSLEILPGKTRREIWTLRDGKHNGFPGLKTSHGLLDLDKRERADHDERWKAAKGAVAKRAEIMRLAQAAKPHPRLAEWPKSGHRDRIKERLAQLRSLEDNRNTAAVPAVFQRFLRALEAEPPFLDQLLRALLKNAESEDAWIDIVRPALIDPIALSIDVKYDGTDVFKLDAADPRQIEAVSRALSEMESGANGSENDGTCAMTGAVSRLLDGSFPQPTLPSLGQTYLFSRNRDIPALARYRRNGPSSFPVDASLVSRFSGALADLVVEGRRGKTWRLLPAEAGAGQDLLIAFVASAMDEPVADSLASDTEDDPEGWQAVEAVGKELITMWEGIAVKSAPGETAHILILRTVDPGNRKAVFDKRPTVEALHRAARTWVKAMDNAPRWITWPVFVRKKIVLAGPRPDSPLSLVSLSCKLFIRGGREAAKAPGLAGAEALALFLNEGNREQHGRRVLRLLLGRHSVLLAGVAHANLRNELKKFDPKGNARIDALRSISWIGALLYFVGRSKENYMHDAGFKLGQLLSAADAVHMGYCADVRNGALPPTLVGNSVFAAAGRTPYRALEVLQTRWKPYEAWVTRAARSIQGKPEKGDTRGWAILRAASQRHHAKRLCEELQPALAEMRTEGRPPDETFRAELLLGYLAGIKSEEHDAGRNKGGSQHE